MNYKNIFSVILLILTGSTFVSAQITNAESHNKYVQKVEEKYPLIFSEINPKHPDTAFEIGLKTEGFSTDFIGVNGKNQFYLVYAQHLQSINKLNLSENYRSNFIQTFQSINRINGLINTNVAYHEVMQTMLIAYAEYALYEIKDLDQSKLSTIDVNKQKKLFIKSIEQKVKTKNQEFKLNSLPNFNRNQELIKTEINNLDKLINDAFALKAAQIFHYTYF